MVNDDIHVFTGRARYGEFGVPIVYTKRYVQGQGWDVWERLDPETGVDSISEIVPVVRADAIDSSPRTIPPRPSYPERQVLTATWNGEYWSKPRTMLDESPRAGSSVTGVARFRARNLDAFMVGPDGSVLTAAWTAGGEWAGWSSATGWAHGRTSRPDEADLIPRG